MEIVWDNEKAPSTGSGPDWNALKISPAVQAERDAFAKKIMDNETGMQLGKPSTFPLTSSTIEGTTAPNQMVGLSQPSNDGSGVIWDDPVSSSSKETPTEKKPEFSLGQNALGLGLGITDFLGGIPGALIGAARGGVDVAANLAGKVVGKDWGNKPSHALEGTMGAMKETMPSSLIRKIPGMPEGDNPLTKSKGYEWGMKPAELIGDFIKYVGKGYAEIAKTLGVSEETAREIDAGTQLGFMAFMGKAKAGAKIGVRETAETRQAYREAYDAMNKGKMFNQKPADVASARESYKETPMKPENVTPEGFAPDLPFGEQRIPVRPPYDVLPEAERARLEAELNPATAYPRGTGMEPVLDPSTGEQIGTKRTELPGQGELFTEERPYGQGELLQGRPAEMTPQEPGVRGMPVQRDITMPGNDMRMGDATERQGAPYEQMGLPKPPDPVQLDLVERAKKIETTIEGLDYSNPISEFGSVGEARARVAEENSRKAGQNKLTSEGVQYTAQQTLGIAKDIFKGPGRGQRGAVDPKVLTEGLRKIKEFLTNDANVLKDDLGSAVVIFRGSSGGSFDPRQSSNAGYKYGGGYKSVYTTDNPYMASAFANKSILSETSKGSRIPTNSNVTPLILKSDVKVIEYIPKPGERSGNGAINWWNFDRAADKLGANEVLVARKSLDFGPATGKYETTKDRAVNDQYAFSDPNVAVPLFEYLASKDLDFSQPSGLRGPGRSQGGFIDFGSLMRKKGVAQAIIEHRKDFNKETRPLADVAKDVLEGKVEDISPIQKGLGRLAIPKQMAILLQHPFVKWAVDHVSEIERKASNSFKSIIEGDTYTKGIRGFEKRIAGKDGALTSFRQLFHKGGSLRAELAEMKDIWLDNVGKEKLTREHFKTDRQWETFAAMKRGLDKVFKDVNAARKAAGAKPFAYVENYFPSKWEGDYRVWVKDAKGTIIEQRAVNTIWEARKLQKAFQKADATLVVEAGPVTKGKYDMSDVSAFEEAARILEKEGNHKLANEFNRIYADVMSHRGGGRSGLKKSGVKGFLGSEKGTIGLKDLERAYENHVRISYRYISNLEKAKLYSEISKLPSEVQAAQSQALGISKSFIDQARGVKDFKDPLTALAEWIGERSGLGANAAKRGLKNISGLVLPYWLLTGKYAMATLTQPLANLAQLSKMKATGDTNRSALVNLFDGYSQLISPDKLGQDGANWASRQGYLDPTITNIMEFGREAPSTSMARRVAEAMRYVPGQLEHHMVRLPSFLMYEKALRDTIKDDHTRFEKAAEMMDDRMVNYNPSNAPLMYTDLGLIGEATRPLKQYSHNIWGQFLDYASFAKDTGKTGPLATFLSTEIGMAGMKGIAFVPEVTAVILFYNLLFNQDTPTPEHMMMTSGMPGWLVQGGLSTALGYDISRSVEHPALPVAVQSAPITLAATALVEVGNWMAKYLKGTHSDADTMRALLAITPNGVHGWIETLYTPEGGYIPNPHDDMKGVYKRDATETWVNNILGLRSIEEAKARNFLRGAKQLLLEDAKQKVEAIEAITDRAQRGEKIDDSLLKRYIDEGGSAQRLTSDIKARIEARQMNPVERALKGNMSPEKAHKLERLKEMLDMDLNNKRSGEKPQETNGEIIWDKQSSAENSARLVGTDDSPEIARIRRGKFHSDLAKKLAPAYNPNNRFSGEIIDPLTRDSDRAWEDKFTDRMPRSGINRDVKGRPLGETRI